MAPGSFSANATEIYQEGLRLPPVKLFRRGEPVQDVWRIMLANHRTPDDSWGDFNAMVGSLRVGLAPARGAVRRARRRRIETAVPALFDYAEQWIRRDIAGLPDGTYSGEDCQEDDGFDKRSYWSARRRHDPRATSMVVDWSRTDPAGSRHHQRAVRRDGVRDVQRGSSR